MRRKLVGDRNEPAAFRHLAEAQQGFDSRIGFRFVDGRMKSLPYTYLVETEFNPDIGIILQFVGHRVTIAGRNLVSLYHGLEDGAVGELVEQHANEMAVEESAAFISRITWEQL
jgi:hypothetical protein